MSVASDTFVNMIITCDTCAVRDIGCNDCVLSYLLIPLTDAPRPVVQEIPDQTAEAIELLASRGIVRPLRFNRAQGE